MTDLSLYGGPHIRYRALAAECLAPEQADVRQAPERCRYFISGASLCGGVRSREHAANHAATALPLLWFGHLDMSDLIAAERLAMQRRLVVEVMGHLHEPLLDGRRRVDDTP